MRVLFIHPNFPAQFRHMAQALGAMSEHECLFATMNERPEWKIPGVTKVVFSTTRQPPEDIPVTARPFTAAAINGEAFYKAAREIRKRDLVPDLIVGHSGWGTTLFAREAFPDARMLCHFEWYYRPDAADTDFDPDQPLDERGRVLNRVRNAPILIDLDACDHGYCPTRWQKTQFPEPFHSRLTTLHDGIDTDFFRPAPDAAASLAEVLPGADISDAREIITYATRGMEPYRGFPQFMRALPSILRRRPGAHVVIAGEDRICYGRPPAEGGSYKDCLLRELDGRLDGSRVHFVGSLPYGRYRQVLQSSSVHVYLTRPFVLSWSMLEAMACGCLLVASDTAPVREIVTDRHNGILTDFFSPEALADSVCEALDRRESLGRLREAARETVVRRYALRTLLPAQLRLLNTVASGSHLPPEPVIRDTATGPFG